MIRIAVFLLSAVFVVPGGAFSQTVSWESLDGPFSGSGGVLFGDQSGLLYWVGGGTVRTSTDGLEWTPTNYPGYPIAGSHIGEDGTILVWGPNGLMIGSDGASGWTHAGLAGESLAAVTRNAGGRLFALKLPAHQCEIVTSNDDGETWSDLPTGSMPDGCGGQIIATGNTLHVLGMPDPDGFAGTSVMRTTNLGQSWIWDVPGGVVNRLVRGQYFGSVFALARPMKGMFSPSHNPQVHLWVPSQWITVSTEYVTAATLDSNGDIVLGHNDGDMLNAPRLGVARPTSIVEAASGNLVVSTSSVGRWRLDDDGHWQQVWGSESDIGVTAAHGDEVFAAVDGTVLRYANDRWIPAGWTRSRPTALAFHGDDLWLASMGWWWSATSAGRDRSFETSTGVWRADSSSAFDLGVECWGHCLTPALVVDGDTAIASHVGYDGFDYVGMAEGLVRTTDAGVTWDVVLAGVDNVCWLAGDSARGFVAANGACGLGMGLPAETFYRSPDGGESWNPVTDGLPGGMSTSVDVAPDGTSFIAIHNQGVYRLGGEDGWEPIGPAGAQVHSMSASSIGQIAAAIEGQLRIWDGVNWVWHESPAPEVSRVLFDAEDRLIIVTSSGLFRTEAPFPVASDPPPPVGQNDALSIFPNPASGVAEVHLGDAYAGEVRVEVVDLLGRTVRAIDRTLDSEGGRLRVDVSHLPAGLYIVRIAGAERSATSRLTIVR